MQNAIMETALAWAVSAKNALQNHGGYSPNQLVFGTIVKLPSVITELAPAVESFTPSDIGRQNLNALQDTRKDFIQAESRERIMQALGHNVRTYCGENYQNGDKVFCKRRAVKGWKGPAIVLGKEANFILIRHGGAFYKCHPCHLMKATQQKSPTTPDVKPVHKDNRCIPGKVHKEKNIQVLILKMTVKQIYEEHERNEGDLKVVSATFLLVCFVCLQESTPETRKNVFYFTSKALFILEIIKF